LGDLSWHLWTLHVRGTGKYYLPFADAFLGNRAVRLRQALYTYYKSNNLGCTSSTAFLEHKKGLIMTIS
jgi:hypothetical protein